jgi:HD superfamily phosphohydrolase
MLSILRRAVELMKIGKLNFLVAGSVMERVLAEAELTVAEYLLFDDHDVMFHIKQWTREPDAILQDLSRRFIERRLFKTIDLDFDEDQRAKFIGRARRRVVDQGFDTDYYLIEDRAADIPYYSYYRPEGKTRLFIERNGVICDIAKVSSVVRGMRGYELHRLCFPQEAALAIEESR